MSFYTIRHSSGCLQEMRDPAINGLRVFLQTWESFQVCYQIFLLSIHD
jgi:hypothetical protein